MSPDLRYKTIIPLHRRGGSLVQHQVKAPEHVRYCQIELGVCETEWDEVSAQRIKMDGR